MEYLGWNWSHLFQAFPRIFPEGEINLGLYLGDIIASIVLTFLSEKSAKGFSGSIIVGLIKIISSVGVYFSFLGLKNFSPK